MIKIWRNDKHIQLVLAGKPSGKDDFSFKNHLTNYPILILDRSKTLEELKNLYINALVFVFPSIYEGFGLPILEAMSCGCPVIGINSTSIPEIIGTAGILVEKDDVDGLAKNIICFTQNNSDSKIISTNCIQQANKFNWNLVAINTIMIYNKMYD